MICTHCGANVVNQYGTLEHKEYCNSKRYIIICRWCKETIGYIEDDKYIVDKPCKHVQSVDISFKR